MSAEPTAIRSAKAEDVPSITAIYAEHVMGGTASFDTVPRTESATLARLEECAQHRWPFWVAERGGALVGYAYITQFRDRPAYAYTCENSIYVRGDRLGQGIGRALLENLTRAAEQMGFRQMMAVCGGGEPASVSLHEVMGFRLVGRMKSVGRKSGRWLDTVYLQLSLGAGDNSPPPHEPS
jgi:L-amino acid N-acyltransferase YncA